MRVDTFIEHLKMYPEDMEVFLQTSPDDLCSPVQRKNFSVMKARHCEKYGLQDAKLVLTAFIPFEVTK